MNPLVIPDEFKHLVRIVNRQIGPFKICTYSVNPTDNKGKILKRGPDDQTYINYPPLVNLIPRACSDLFVGDKLIGQIRGMNKFDGTSSIDEDEAPYEGAAEDNGSTIFNHDIIKEWNDKSQLETSFVEKANGKFAICVLLKHFDKYWLFGGSKNAHVIVEYDKEIKGTELHYQILNCMMVDIKKCPPDSLVGRIIIGEYVDGQHMVYTDKPYMVYFDLTLPVPFMKAKILLPTINTIPTNLMLRSLRELEDIEGVVINYRNITTNHVVRQKHKSVWYIVLRSWREAIYHCSKEKFPSYNGLTQLIRTRLITHNKSYLHLDEETFNKWYLMADIFGEWLYNSNYKFSDLNPFGGLGMANIWHQFMNRNSKSSKLEALPEQVRDLTITDILTNPEYYSSIVPLAKIISITIIMIGLPGTGKSSVSHKLKSDLESNKISCDIFNTDEYFMVNGQYCFDQTKLGIYHAKNFEAFKSSKAQVRIVDNTNLSQKDYAQYCTSAIGNVHIFLCTKLAPLSVLMQRNKHNVPIKVLDSMMKRYHITVPSYIGLFPNPNSLTQFPITQKTPLHVTSIFVGKQEKAVPSNIPYGTIVEVEIIGISNNKDGTALIVKPSKLGNTQYGSGNHITLGTKGNSKPVSVGTSITPSNTILFSSSIMINCVVGVMF